MMSTRFPSAVFSLLLALPVMGQRAAVRTNLLYDATLTPNLGAEVRVDTVWTLGVNVGLNAWDIDSQTNKKWRHVLVNPMLRKYLLKRETASYYLSHRDSVCLRRAAYVEGGLLYSHFNVGNTRIPFGIYDGVKTRRLQGDLLALGGKYGYSWMLSRFWRVEAEAGIAVGYAWFKEYDCPHCGSFLGNGDRIFLLPQLGINVVYIIN